MLLVQVQEGSSPQRLPHGQDIVGKQPSTSFGATPCLSQCGRDWSQLVPELGMAATSPCPPGIRADYPKMGLKT